MGKCMSVTQTVKMGQFDVVSHLESQRTKVIGDLTEELKSTEAVTLSDILVSK